MLFAEVGIVLGVIGLTAMIAGAGVSIYSGYQAYDAARESARMQTDAANAAANAQRMAAQAQADQLRDKAELAGLQASIEDKKAGVAQEQGRIEEQRRMIQLSYDIGNTYAQWAGNGLLVDGGNDTLGQLLTANAREAGQDVGIIRSNTENAVWEHSMNKSMALLTQKSYEGAGCEREDRRCGKRERDASLGRGAGLRDAPAGLDGALPGVGQRHRHARAGRVHGRDGVWSRRWSGRDEFVGRGRRCECGELRRLVGNQYADQCFDGLECSDDWLRKAFDHGRT